MKIPEGIPVIQAGEYPKELAAGCAALGVEPGELLDWAVKKEEVVLVLATGQKGRVVVSGQWSGTSSQWPVMSGQQQSQQDAVDERSERGGRRGAAAKKK